MNALQRRIALTAVLSVTGMLLSVSASTAIEATSTSIEKCKLVKQNQNPLSPGFPRDSALMPSTGTIRTLFLYVDFPDNTSAQNNKTFTAQYATATKKFLETQSYDRAKFIFDSTEKTFRINKKSSSYGLIQDGRGDAGRLVQDAINAADAAIDFGKYDLVTVVPPKDTKTILFSGALTGGAGSFKSVEKDFSSAVWIGQNKLSNFNQPGFGWSFYTHELGHVLGLTHPYFQRNGGPGAIWDLMGNGGTSVPELIGWHRFLLDWIPSKQIRCISKATLSKEKLLISPINTKNAGTKFAMVSLNSKHGLIIEVRRSSAYDKLLPSEEGILVYKVDTTKGDDEGIITVLGKKGTKREGQTLESLRKGEKVTYEGVTIRVTASSKAGDTVEIYTK